MPLRQRAQLGNKSLVAAEREIGLDAFLERRQPQLLQALGLGAREVLVGELAESRPAPQREGLPDGTPSARRVPRGERGPTLIEEALEAGAVELPRPQ